MGAGGSVSRMRGVTEEIIQDLIPTNPAEVHALIEAVQWCWELHARPEQLMPSLSGDWRYWLVQSGRGWGKTRCAAEAINEVASSGYTDRIHLVARTSADVRDVMVTGASGLCNVSHPSKRPRYYPSKRLLVWDNGVKATTFSADEPDLLRGPECGFFWCDEIATWRYINETWDMLQMGARRGDRVRGIITSTPRPIKLLKEIIADPHTIRVRGCTFDNAANLAPSYLDQMRKKYAGTRLGRQELDGEILEDNPGALWTYRRIDEGRVSSIPLTGLKRIVVALDPSIKAEGDRDQAGIVVSGESQDGEYFVLDDRTISGSPKEWADATIRAYLDWSADLVIYESNQGGAMVEEVLRNVDKSVPTRGVTATRGKFLRAEPISALYEQGRVHHVGTFPELEDEMCEWTNGDPKSPNRLDAMVYSITELSAGCEPGYAGGGWNVSPGGY